MGTKLFNIAVLAKCQQSSLVQVIVRFQELKFGAIQDYPNVQELLALHPGYHADDGIFKQVFLLHFALLL